MNIMLKTICSGSALIRRFFALVFCALLLAALVLPPQPAYAAEHPFSFTVTQEFVQSSGAARDEFSYVMRPLEQGIPMPAGSGSKGYAFELKGNASATIGPIDYGYAHIYRYEIAQLNSGEKGYSYDKRIYTVEVHVNADLLWAMVVFNNDAGHTKAEKIVFRNSYKPLATDPAEMKDIVVDNRVTGNPKTDTVFEFVLKPETAGLSSQSGAARSEQRIRIKGEGRGRFDSWSYEQAGVYFYTVYEVNAGASGYVYDTKIYTVTDTVRDVDGQLALESRVVTDSLNKPVGEPLSFVNRYNSFLPPRGDGNGGGNGGVVAAPGLGGGSLAPVPQTGKDSIGAPPQTGDGSYVPQTVLNDGIPGSRYTELLMLDEYFKGNVPLFALLFAVIGCVMLFWLIGAKRRRKREDEAEQKKSKTRVDIVL